MKGFIYLIEIAIAAVLLTLILENLFVAQSVKLNWERSDLIGIGNNLFFVLKSSGDLQKILTDHNVLEDINKLKPPNIDYGLKISGTPSSNITVGCVQSCDHLTEFLTPAYVNNRWINFTVITFDINAGEIPDFDSVALIDYTGYSQNKDKINRYLAKGRTVLAIDGINYDNPDFLSIFNLSSLGFCKKEDWLNFTKYSPEENKIPKYFLGFGFDVKTPYEWDFYKKFGYWYVWEDKKEVNITQTYVEIEGATPNKVVENETFIMTGFDGTPYNFKVKKIFWPGRVDFQALDTTFKFKDFTQGCVKGGNKVISGSSGDTSDMTTNRTAIWLAGWLPPTPESEEYRALIKSALATSTVSNSFNEWYLVDTSKARNSASVSSFVPLCCDMPETAEFTFILWYVY